MIEPVIYGSHFRAICTDCFSCSLAEMSELIQSYMTSVNFNTFYLLKKIKLSLVVAVFHFF